jgi:hypothetical protein
VRRCGVSCDSLPRETPEGLHAEADVVEDHRQGVNVHLLVVFGIFEEHLGRLERGAGRGQGHVTLWREAGRGAISQHLTLTTTILVSGSLLPSLPARHALFGLLPSRAQGGSPCSADCPSCPSCDKTLHGP